MIRVSFVALAVAACGGSSGSTPDSATMPRPDAPVIATADARVDGSPVPAGDYDHDGTVPYTTSVEHVTGGTTEFDVTIYMPSTPGLHPAVSLSCGSTQTAAGYVPYAQRLASHGIAMFLT